MSARDLLRPGCVLYIAGHADLMRSLGWRMTDERIERVADRMASLLANRLEIDMLGVLGKTEIAESFQQAMREAP